MIVLGLTCNTRAISRLPRVIIVGTVRHRAIQFSVFLSPPWAFDPFPRRGGGKDWQATSPENCTAL